MDITRYDFEAIPQLSALDKAYAQEVDSLRPFYQHPVQLEQFERIIQQRHFPKEHRSLLVEELERQYQDMALTEATRQNIQALRADNSYTLITAHQPNLMTGPLYVIYKIATTLNLTQQLRQAYPEQQFVPVFWMGGEDHDFEEVNHLHLFGNRITWTDEQGGPVGAYQTDSLGPILDQLEEILGQSERAQAVAQRLREYFRAGRAYSEGMRDLLHWIFGDYGLVLVNASTPVFKRLFIPILEDELLHQTSKPIVEQTIAQLEEAGYSQQAHARAINVFYLQAGRRDRIERTANDHYRVLDTDLVFSKSELIEELHAYPERFSPNVILRPLFQETILPNLAYIGGGGELAYWLERKAQFEHYGVPFPMLVRRCSVLWIPPSIAKLMDKLNIDTEAVFADTHPLLKRYIVEQSEEALSLAPYKAELDAVFERLTQKITRIDPGLEKSVLAQQANTQKALEKLEQRLIRAEKHKNESSIQQIEKIKQTLFPNQGLQERHDNFFGFYLRYGQTFVQTLVEHLDPLQKQFWVVRDDQ